MEIPSIVVQQIVRPHRFKIDGIVWKSTLAVM